LCSFDRGRDIAAIWDFQNLKFLTFGTVKRVELHNHANRNMAIFLFFKMAAAAILDFRNFKSLTSGAVKRVELRHHAKFR